MTVVPTREQAAVVSQPLRSFRVAAGAGTGKTTTIALRVAALVTDFDVDPEQILGITFTNKAAGELAERIGARLAGIVDPGREVEVHTYHGYAFQILREFGALVGIERNTKLVTPTFTRQILSDVVRAAPLATWDLANVYNIDRVVSFIGELGDNLLAATDVAVPEVPDEVWLKRADLLSVSRLYQHEKQRMGVADYSDLISAAWRVVHDHPEVGAAIADRYRAVVLDEYQDTNPAQRELLRTIFAGRVPVTAVGDADQTIYEWRGASLENFADFGRHFPNAAEPAPSLPLTTNRRSGEAILAAANAIRRRLHSEPDPLVAVAGTPPGVVHTAWFGTAAEEAAWIADRIEALHDDGLAWRDCAVLFRKTKDMQVVHDALAQRDIPYEVANLGGLLSVPEVSDLVAWLRVLARAEDTVALARLLVGSRYRLGLADLARLSDWVRDRRQNVEDDLEGLPDYTLVEAFDHLDEVSGLRPEALDALRVFRAEHREFLAAAQGLSLVELCRTVLDRTGAWQDVDAMPSASGLSARLNLFRFLDLAESWSPLEGRPSLPSFTAYLELMRDNPREELDTARVSDADAVTLITVHRAKGLEWEAVFLPAAYRDNFPSRYRGNDPYTSPEILPFEFRLDRASLPAIGPETDKDDRTAALRRRHDEAEWRLAYVAVTRARQHLTVSGAWWYGHPIPLSRSTVPSALFEVAKETGTMVHDTAEPPTRPSRAAYRPHASAPDPGLDAGWAGALRLALENAGWAEAEAERLGLGDSYEAAMAVNQQRLFALPPPLATERPSLVTTSATGLVTYAVCPRRYYWTAVDPLPRRASAAARRGTDVHRRIELHNVGVVPLQDFESTDYDLTDVGDAVGRGDPFGVFRSSAYADRSPLLTEVPFELRRRGGTVRGRIDAVYDRDGTWEIVDFKSGRARPDGANLVQLQTYALAVADIDFGLPPPRRLTAAFVYLGGGGVEVSAHRVDDDWMRRAASTVDSLLAGMHDDHWDVAPSSECRGCDFLRFCPEGRRQVSSM